MKIPDLTIGINFKRCSECEYKNDNFKPTVRDDFLVSAGRQAACMDHNFSIDLPAELDREHEVAMEIADMVDEFLNTRSPMPFHEYLDRALRKKYGKENNYD